MIPTGFDTETFLIGPGAVAPKMVCYSAAWYDDDGALQTGLMGNGDAECEASLKELLTDEDRLLVTHNGGYDYTVIAASYPDLIPFIFQALLAGRCTDTLWREKLLNLSTTGRLTEIQLPDGTTQKISYSLAALETFYLGIDRSAEKADIEEAWRLNYCVLDGWPASEYPEDAAGYAIDDVIGTLGVYMAQEKRALEQRASLATQEFQLAADFALRLMTVRGMQVHPGRVAEMRVAVEAKLAQSEPPLVEAGLLRPSQPTRPHARQMKKALAELGIEEAPEDFDWTPHVQALTEKGVKFVEAKRGSIDTKKLQKHLTALYKSLGEIPTMTSGGEKSEPQIQFDSEVQDYLADKDPLIASYRDRQSLGKIVTNVLPVMESGGVIHFNYNALVETGRTSSYGNPKGKPALYPATNGQNVPKQIEDLDPRRAYQPRPGTVFFDADVTNLELGSVGQATYDLLGHSVHRDRYNAGFDLHAYLAAQIVVMSAADEVGKSFTQLCREDGLLTDPVKVYEAFLSCKDHDDPEVAKFYKHYRDLAKPVGLGYPGGLGPDTFIDFARKTYSVDVTRDQAVELREMWHDTYPEMKPYFDWVNGQTDDRYLGSDTCYAYTTPLGMVRRGATFCSVANGYAMQSPGAEGMKVACIKVAQPCYDPTLKSVLFGCRPIAFVHDQIIGETTQDQSLWHEQCLEVRRLILEALTLVMPDIIWRSDEAHLTSVWSKSSKPVFDAEGRLIPWAPE